MLDLNRPREEAVYRTPEDCWGLHVWDSPPPDGIAARSLSEYDAFGEADMTLVEAVKSALGSTVTGVLEELAKL